MGSNPTLSASFRTPEVVGSTASGAAGSTTFRSDAHTVEFATADDNNAVGSVEFDLFRARFGGTPGLAGPGLQIPNHVSDKCIQAAFPGSD